MLFCCPLGKDESLKCGNYRKCCPEHTKAKEGLGKVERLFVGLH